MFVNPHGSMGGYQITNSVRLRAAASAYFSRTFGAGGDRDKWWILIPEKRSTLGATQYLFGSDTASADAVYFNASDKICVDIAGTNRLISTRVFRDPSAWGAFLVVFDASNGTNDLKLRVYYIDSGFAEITAWDTNTRSAITAGTAKTTLNTAAAVIGKNPTAASGYFDGYLSHFHIGTWSGSQPTPASFGGTDSNGVWVFSGASSAYGTQGSWLDFKDAAVTAGSNAGLGKDISGNGNYWTTNNISVTAGVTYDAMVDTPTNVYATLNPIIASAANISYAALRSGMTAVQATEDAAAFTNSGAYWEVTAAGSAVTAGLISGTGATNTTTVTANKVFGFRLVSGALSYINITDAGSWTSITTGLTGQQFPYGVTQAADWNFGQRPFSGTPSGQALCTANLPAVAIPKPSVHFQAVLDVGANIKATCEALYTYFVEWIKDRANAQNHQSLSTIRSTSTALHSNVNDAPSAYSAPAGNSVGWVWNAGAASTLGTGTGGITNVSYSANTLAGISSGKYTGSGSAGTITHGLGVAPAMVWVKDYTAANSNRNAVYHSGMTDATYWMYTEGTVAQAVDTTVWNGTAPTSSVFSVGTSTNTNTNTNTYEFLAFAEVPGFSKAWSVTGNGSADGPFVYCGFRPKFILGKQSQSTGGRWWIYDTTRKTYNYIGGEYLAANSTAIGTDDGSNYIDELSNGFKFRTANNEWQTGSAKTIGMAFAEYPFGGSNVSPSPAR